MTGSGAGSRGLPGRDPWEKFGWTMGAVWLVFLVFPLVSVLRVDSLWVRCVGLLLLATFAAVVVHGYARLARDKHGSLLASRWLHLGILVLLGVALGWVIDTNALGTLPYVVAYAVFAFTLPVAAAIGTSGLVLTVLLPLLQGTFAERWIFLLIVLMVFVVTLVVRLVDQRHEVHRGLQAELALAEERDRVARDVHDVLGHSLTVVTVKAELAERLVDSDPARAKEELAQVQSLTREALAEIRATVAGLRVARLSEELVAAEQALTAAGIDVDLPDDPEVVDPRHRIVIAWVLREAVTNVVRHSGAGRCTVEITTDTLRVSDDGDGAGDAPEQGGLRGIRERVRTAGGTASLEPLEPGTRLTVEF
ncbi:MAG: sensor histidine kinase [Propionibacteriaceae bacterium]